MSSNKRISQRIDMKTNKCAKCAQDIKNKEFMKCSICELTLHLECTNVTLKRFYLMSKNTKEIWKCRRCLETVVTAHALPSISKIEDTNRTSDKSLKNGEKRILNKSTENVTMRKKNIDRLSSSSLHSLNSSLDGSTMESLSISTRSMPNTTENVQISDLKDTIDLLRTQLISAHEEITNLNGDITRLTKNQTDLERQIAALKGLLGDGTSSRKTTPKQMKRKSNSLGKKAVEKSSTQFSISVQDKLLLSNQEPCKIKDTTIKNDIANKIINTNVKNNKVCVISSNKRNNILYFAKDALSNRFQVCHYLLPNMGIRELFSSLQTKVKDYTINDYCIILIGEEDFKETKNYSTLVTVIRRILLNIDHTNFIICLPTYKCNMGIMYNWRVEKFNNLLYHDNLNYEYSFLLDSNLDLSFDYDMFYRTTGVVNNYGIRKIFQGIIKTIAHIENYNDYTYSINTHKDVYTYADQATQTDEEPWEYHMVNNSSFRE